jgi:hypothetical protein
MPIVPAPRAWWFGSPAAVVFLAAFVHATVPQEHGAREALVAFHLWSEDLRAYDASGKTLWSYQGGGGVDDVWVSDLNGDGADEVIVGYNGASGERPLGLHGSGETMAGTGPGPVGLRLFWRL